jgi:hypothetical protein
MAESFPLDWPVGYPKTHSRGRAPYKATAGRARDQVMRELTLMGVSDWNVIISTNCPISSRTSAFLVMKGEPADLGVAVYFRRKDGGPQAVLACDKWDKVADNLRAIAMTIEAMRGMDRWGVSEMLDRVFQGFTALPAPAEQPKKREWFEVLGVDPRDSLDLIESMYRLRAKEVHTDLGGDHSSMVELNAAIAYARKVKRGAA